MPPLRGLTNGTIQTDVQPLQQGFKTGLDHFPIHRLLRGLLHG